MQNADYDVVIVGGGPAGLTAGMYASRARLKTVMIEKAVPGGQILLTDWMENYPGFPEGLTGADLVQKMRAQARKFDLRNEINEVLSMDLSRPVKQLQLTGKTITARSIIIASGARPRKLGIPGEKRFFGKGVSTCATCDAPFYKDRVAVAVGGGDTAVQESLYLAKFAKKVYLVHRRDRLRAAKILQERLFRTPNIDKLAAGGISGLSIILYHFTKFPIANPGIFPWPIGFGTGRIKRNDFYQCFLSSGILG